MGTTIKYSDIDMSWYDARQSSRSLSQLVHYPADCQDFFDTDPPPRNFFPNNLIVISDGTCGSACGLFISKMQQGGAAKIVTHGGTTDGGPVSNTFDRKYSTVLLIYSI